MTTDPSTDSSPRSEASPQLGRLLESLSREAFVDQLANQLEHARLGHSTLGVIQIDLDGFKVINDDYGRVTGDLLLDEVTERLKQIVRARDYVARLGGDEFALILADLSNLDQLIDEANRILGLIALPITIDGHSIVVTASLGVTAYPLDNADAATLWRHADQAMLQAKMSGRNAYHLFDARHEQHQQVHQKGLTGLARGLAQDELVLYYQPKVNLRSGTITGVEALLRWQHPEQGLLLPGVFLPQAEHDDLIIDIGVWVIRQALTQASAWLAQGLDITISVNIAARQLLRGDFLTTLRRCLDEHPDVPADHLEIEILESAALEDVHHVQDIIRVCHEWGVGFALDDFGTGYASLAYLRDIPADVLKIDRSFINDVLDNHDDLTLVEGIIGLATAFRRVVVAEGVENAEQGVLLMRLGCDIVQGFGIARPMPAGQVLAWAGDYRPNPQWALWAGIPWAMEDFPLLVAQHDHILWTRRVLDYLESDPARIDQIDQAELVDHHRCRFGRWYDHHGRTHYGHLQDFIELDPVHQTIHQIGAEIVRLHCAGDSALALAKVGTLLALKDEVLRHLGNLQRSVAYGADPANDDAEDGMQLAGIPRLHASSRRTSAVAAKRALILVVDDTPANIELLAGALSEHYEIVFATHGDKALELTHHARQPDLILLDVMMPGMDGFELCRRLKASNATRHIPVIFVTARNEIADQEHGFNIGAVDYITKPFNLPLVRARVRTHVNLKLRTDLLEAQASLDGLTGIANRRRFDDVFHTEWKRAARNQAPISLLMLDVDHFKDFNDRYGHGAGDECLRKISVALTSARARPGDLAARYGGEEFAVILPGCNSTGAHAIAERMRRYVEAMLIPHDRSPVADHITISIGCATHIPALNEPIGHLQHQADQCLYRAKQEGRNQICVSISSAHPPPRED